MARLTNKNGGDSRKKQSTRFGGCISKSTNLTAMEKRRRMIEAGKKYAALNGITLHVGVTQQPQQTNQGDAKCTNLSSLITEQKTVGLHMTDSSKVAEEENVGNDVKKDNINNIEDIPRPKELHRLLPPLPAPSTRYQHDRSGKALSIPQSALSNRYKPPNSYFEKDAGSLRDIMSERPITQIIGRPSHTRHRERLSLFPNGINPLDEAAERIPSPSTSSKDSNLFSTYPNHATTPGVISLLETPLACGVRSSHKKTSKSVHFNDNIAFRSPSISSLEEPQPSDLLRLNVSDEELDAQLCSLPFGTIMKLKDAVHRIAITRSGVKEDKVSLDSEELQHIKEDSPKETKERGNHWKRQTPSKKLLKAGSWSASKLQAVTEEESCTTRMLTRSAGSIKAMALTRAPRDEDRKVLSQVYADQEVMILTSRTKRKRFNDTNGRPADPLVSLFGTPENHFMPISPQQK